MHLSPIQKWTFRLTAMTAFVFTGSFINACSTTDSEAEKALLDKQIELCERVAEFYTPVQHEGIEHNTTLTQQKATINLMLAIPSAFGTVAGQVDCIYLAGDAVPESVTVGTKRYDSPAAIADLLTFKSVDDIEDHHGH